MRSIKYQSQYSWKDRNKDKVREINRRWRKANPDKLKEYDRAAYIRNGDKIRARKRKTALKYRKENAELVRARARERYRNSPYLGAWARHAGEMRSVISVLTGKPVEKGLSLKELYRLMFSVVKKNLSLAKKKFPHGLPDAAEFKIEYKVGLDRLHRDQFVWNILNGHDCRVRWSPSWSAIEEAIAGGENKSLLFSSYKEFVLWRYGKDNGTADWFAPASERRKSDT